MEEILDAAAMFIMKERLNPRIIEPFPQETEAEKAAKKKEALRHSREVEMLRRKALSEAGETAKELDPEIIRAMKALEIKSKPAMKQLIGICINGFQ